MGLFKKKQEVIDFPNIDSVVILQQTQLYSKESHSGKSFGWHAFDTRYYDLPDTLSPEGMEYTFSITYKDGHKQITTMQQKDERCARLLQFVYDPDVSAVKKVADIFGSLDVSDEDESEPSANEENTKMPNKSIDPNFQLGKNQLPQGKYEIGKDIPAGQYDFKVVLGGGSLNHYFTDEKAKDGKGYDFFWIGTEKSYENPLVIGRTFYDGDILELHGNVVVEISRSKKIQLDL